jgi:DNA-binding NarL/FixJ family response regulator
MIGAFPEKISSELMNPQDQPQRAAKKVLVIDDHILFREGLMSLFRFSPDFEVVGGAGNVREGVDQARFYLPDIILMDFSLPDGTGLDATRAILAFHPSCQIVFLTVYEADDKLFAALRLGAKGYMLKNVASSDLLSSLRALERGEKAISRKMMSSVLDEFAQTQVGDANLQVLLAKLSPREMEVLRELESGASNELIARHLFLSENTVKHHIRNVLDKLGVENRREAGLLARQNGITKTQSTG